MHLRSSWNLQVLATALVLALGPTACLAQSSPPEADMFYDETWAGPVRIAAGRSTVSPAAPGFTSAEATLVMPRLAVPRAPTSGRPVDQYTAAFWVGLDGFLPSAETPAATVRGLWQAGVFMSVWPNGTARYTGFHEWVPDDPVDVAPSDLALAEGDHLRVVLRTSNASLHGSVTMTNLNTSAVFAYEQDAPTSWRGPTWPSPGSSAEWIVEAGTYLNTTRFVLPDWGTATFLGARACYANGTCALPADGESRTTAVLMNATNTLYTRSTVNGDRVDITYVEEPLAV